MCDIYTKMKYGLGEWASVWGGWGGVNIWKVCRKYTNSEYKSASMNTRTYRRAFGCFFCAFSFTCEKKNSYIRLSRPKGTVSTRIKIPNKNSDGPLLSVNINARERPNVCCAETATFSTASTYVPPSSHYKPLYTILLCYAIYNMTYNVYEKYNNVYVYMH